MILSFLRTRTTLRLSFVRASILPRVLSIMVKEMARPILINHATSAPLNGCPARKETAMTVTTRRSAATLLLWVRDRNKALAYMVKQTK
jgi:hypothetical protein